MDSFSAYFSALTICVKTISPSSTAIVVPQSLSAPKPTDNPKNDSSSSLTLATHWSLLETILYPSPIEGILVPLGSVPGLNAKGSCGHKISILLNSY